MSKTYQLIRIIIIVVIILAVAREIVDYKLEKRREELRERADELTDVIKKVSEEIELNQNEDNQEELSETEKVLTPETPIPPQELEQKIKKLEKESEPLLKIARKLNDENLSDEELKKLLQEAYEKESKTEPKKSGN